MSRCQGYLISSLTGREHIENILTFLPEIDWGSNANSALSFQL